MTATINESKFLAASICLIYFIWEVNGLYFPYLAGISKSVFWAIDLCQWVFIPGVIMYVINNILKLSPASYGLKFRDVGIIELCTTSILCFASIYSAMYVTKFILPLLIGFDGGSFSWGSVFPSGSLRGLVCVYAAVTAGVVESIFFIGLPWLLWERHKLPSKLLFSVLVSTVFATTHWEQGINSSIEAFIFQLTAFSWYFYRKSIFPIIIAHTAIDLVEFI